MSDQTITIGESTFDHLNYDRDADVLYLSVGDPQPAAQTYGTPEGHAVRYDRDGRIIGMTLVNAKLLHDLAGAQPQPRQQHQDREVAAAVGAAPVAAVEQATHLPGLEGPRQTRYSSSSIGVTGVGAGGAALRRRR